MLRVFCFAVFIAVAANVLFGQEPNSERSRPDQRKLELRLDDAVAEIAMLKRLVMEQNQRITALERTVQALRPTQSAAARMLITWEGIKLGMSRAQVVEILGEPKFTEAVMDRQTLLYGTDVTNPLGKVVIIDDRVTQVEYPRGRVILTVPPAK
jgi:hypothetical protein